jgi:HK97 family phage major capsid protein
MERELREFKAHFEVRGKSPSKIIGSIPYRSKSHPIGGEFIEVLLPGVFRDSINSGIDVKSFWNHDTSKVLGSTAAGTLKLIDGSKELRVELTPPNNTWGRDALESVGRGDTNGFSFSFSPIDVEFSDDSETRYIKKANLYSVDPTAIPAYPESKAFARSHENKENTLRGYKKYFRRGSENMKKDYSKVDKFFNRNMFSSNVEYLRALIMSCSNAAGVCDHRLERATGLGEDLQSGGGFLVKKELMDNFLYGETASELYRRCSKFPVSEGVFQVKFPMLSETSRAEGEAFGGLRLYFEEEADDVATSTPKFRSNNLSLKRAIGICPVTDELMQDGPFMEKFLSNVFGQALRYTIDHSIIRGKGSGQPLGIINAQGTLEIEKETAQNPGEIVGENILKMISALPAESHQDACFIVNPECLQQLYSMGAAIGTAGSVNPLWRWRAGGEKYSKLAGFDCIPNEHCSKIGDRGDIILASLSAYAIIEKKLRETISAHLYFLTDQSAFRLVYRFDGQPLWNRPITPKHATSGEKISPFIVLQSRN